MLQLLQPYIFGLRAEALANLRVKAPCRQGFLVSGGLRDVTVPKGGGFRMPSTSLPSHPKMPISQNQGTFLTWCWDPNSPEL